MKKQKIIIFGAGNYGRSAYEYYGDASVDFFVDNNKEKIGKKVCGKEIISFTRLMEIYEQYVIVIACNHFFEISKQLMDAGVENFRCYSPVFMHMKERLSENGRIENCNIILYGMSNDTPAIVSALTELGYMDNVKGILRSRFDTVKDLPLNIPVLPVIDSSERNVCIIITEMNNNAALCAEIGIKYKEALVINPFKQVAYYDTDELIVNPYSENCREITEQEWNDSLQGDINKIEIRNYVNAVKDDVPLFQYVEIETVNRCNGVCSFCPVNRKIDSRVETQMDFKVFKKIINELSDLNYSGEISLFSNNEPLLDERIIELHKYTRNKLPNARIHMFTNGTLLSVPLFKELIVYLDELIIDNYRQDLKLIKPVSKVKDYIEEHPELKKKVTIVLRKPNEILTSRGGDAPNRDVLVTYENETCALPFEQLIIRPDGKVSLCCNDPLGRNTLGDLTKESLKEVWYGSKFATVRKSLAEGRKNWKHCEFCDTFYLY